MDDVTKLQNTEKNTLKYVLPTWLKISLVAVVLVVVSILILYFGMFYGAYGTQETFAQFGDFIGGTINPILGFATVGLLIWSINIQLHELRETRSEARQSRIAFENQLNISRDEVKLRQIQISIDNYLQERELVLSQKLPHNFQIIIFDILIKKHNLKSHPADILYKKISALTYKNCIIPFAKIRFSAERLSGIKQNEIDEIITDFMRNDEYSKGQIKSALFMSLQISKSWFDYHELTLYKKHSVAMLWKHSCSYLEPFKDFIDENDLISLVSEFPQSDIPSFYNELKIQIEKVNELHVDF